MPDKTIKSLAYELEIHNQIKRVDMGPLRLKNSDSFIFQILTPPINVTKRQIKKKASPKKEKPKKQNLFNILQMGKRYLCING